MDIGAYSLRGRHAVKLANAHLIGLDLKRQIEGGGHAEHVGRSFVVQLSCTDTLLILHSLIGNLLSLYLF
jgi:hypothetical protein